MNFRVNGTLNSLASLEDSLPMKSITPYSEQKKKIDCSREVEQEKQQTLLTSYALKHKIDFTLYKMVKNIQRDQVERNIKAGNWVATSITYKRAGWNLNLLPKFTFKNVST
ncbi:hypothetical protein Fot_55256 [Forsythia ovata]|uniref:Uncharacterized protein n=1 Tax=Forsythia ovata TaxID=205694 RepID=A0ABD1P526_9LAMI